MQENRDPVWLIVIHFLLLLTTNQSINQSIYWHFDHYSAFVRIIHLFPWQPHHHTGNCWSSDTENELIRSRVDRPQLLIISLSKMTLSKLALSATLPRGVADCEDSACIKTWAGSAKALLLSQSQTLAVTSYYCFVQTRAHHTCTYMYMYKSDTTTYNHVYNLHKQELL